MAAVGERGPVLTRVARQDVAAAVATARAADLGLPDVHGLQREGDTWEIHTGRPGRPRIPQLLRWTPALNGDLRVVAERLHTDTVHLHLEGTLQGFPVRIWTALERTGLGLTPVEPRREITLAHLREWAAIEQHEYHRQQTVTDARLSKERSPWN